MASSLIIVVVLAVWLYGTLVLPERRAGYTIMLLGSLLGRCARSDGDETACWIFGHSGFVGIRRIAKG